MGSLLVPPWRQVTVAAGFLCLRALTWGHLAQNWKGLSVSDLDRSGMAGQDLVALTAGKAKALFGLEKRENFLQSLLMSLAGRKEMSRRKY